MGDAIGVEWIGVEWIGVESMGICGVCQTSTTIGVNEPPYVDDTNTVCVGRLVIDEHDT